MSRRLPRRVLRLALPSCLLALAIALPLAFAPGLESPASAIGRRRNPPPPPAPPPPPGPATPIGPTQLWFTPNLASDDLIGLFTQPDRWDVARGRTRVLKLYNQQIRPAACPSCGPNEHAALVGADAFRKLRAWGIDLAIEVGAIKEWGCTAEPMARRAGEVIRTVEDHGGRVRYLAMDEPLLGGQHTMNNRSCGMTRDAIATQVADYVARVKRDFPHVDVGDIEPYPRFDARELVAWIDALLARGTPLAFFHLDVDMNHVENIDAPLDRDLRALQDHCRARGIPFGVIFIGRDRDGDRAYYDHAMGFAGRVKRASGLPDHVVFQSWIDGPGGRRVPINLPESGPNRFTHTRLIHDGWALLVDNDARFISWSVPDTVRAGERFRVSVTMENAGPIAWTRRDAYKLGVEATGAAWGTTRATLGAGDRVPPGGRTTFAFELTAPARAGSHALRLRMVQELCEWFGAPTPEKRVTVTP